MIPYVATAALALLLAVAVFLLVAEWRRYLKDRMPAPPPTPEEASLDRWNAGVVMLVAGISISGALLAWWAASQFSAAANASQQALTEATQYQTVKAEQDGYVDFGARLAESYQEHTVAATQLYSEAASAWSAGQGNVALELETQARLESAQARALYPGFVCYWPFYSSAPGGRVDFNVAQEKASEAQGACTQADQDPTALRTLGPAAVAQVEATASSDRGTAEEIVLAGALLIVAVFFMTMSYLAWRHRRAHYLAPGVVSVAAALVVCAAAAVG